MNQLTTLLFFLIPFYAIAQTDTLTRYVDRLEMDTTWNESINNCDLILYLNIEETFYITNGGIFSGKVLDVIKGKFSQEKVGWSMGMIEMGAERWNGRFEAIYPKDWKKPYLVYAGFMKTDSRDAHLFDKKARQGYMFFMSVEKLTH